MFQVLFKIGHKFTYFVKKIGRFSQNFRPNKGNLDIPLFVKVLNFDANKGKTPLLGVTLFGVTTVRKKTLSYSEANYHLPKKIVCLF